LRLPCVCGELSEKGVWKKASPPVYIASISPGRRDDKRREGESADMRTRAEERGEGYRGKERGGGRRGKRRGDGQGDGAIWDFAWPWSTTMRCDLLSVSWKRLVRLIWAGWARTSDIANNFCPTGAHKQC
jgi:hypothetical protein